MRQPTFHPEAEAEMIASARCYEEKQELLGRRFLDCVNTAVRRVGRSPKIFQKIEDGCRRCRVDRFPYGIIFREGEGGIQIIAVMHFRQEPGYWRDRT